VGAGGGSGDGAAHGVGRREMIDGWMDDGQLAPSVNAGSSGRPDVHAGKSMCSGSRSVSQGRRRQPGRQHGRHRWLSVPHLSDSLGFPLAAPILSVFCSWRGRACDPVAVEVREAASPCGLGGGGRLLVICALRSLRVSRLRFPSVSRLRFPLASSAHRRERGRRCGPIDQASAANRRGTCMFQICGGGWRARSVSFLLPGRGSRRRPRRGAAARARPPPPPPPPRPPPWPRQCAKALGGLGEGVGSDSLGWWNLRGLIGARGRGCLPVKRASRTAGFSGLCGGWLLAEQSRERPAARCGRPSRGGHAGCVRGDAGRGRQAGRQACVRPRGVSNLDPVPIDSTPPRPPPRVAPDFEPQAGPVGYVSIHARDADAASVRHPPSSPLLRKSRGVRAIPEAAGDLPRKRLADPGLITSLGPCATAANRSDDRCPTARGAMRNVRTDSCSSPLFFISLSFVRSFVRSFFLSLSFFLSHFLPSCFPSVSLSFFLSRSLSLSLFLSLSVPDAAEPRFSGDAKRRADIYLRTPAHPCRTRAAVFHPLRALTRAGRR